MTVGHRTSLSVVAALLLGMATAVADVDIDPYSAMDLERVLPIETPELESGRALARPLPTRLPRPLFLIGTDHRSLLWLKARRDSLRQLNAVGLVVDANSVTALKRLLAAGDGLLMVPASASDIARALHLTHYPVLLVDDRAEP
ncbi:MAG: PFL_4695 family integrating conjugative element protein [Gammaproteobacteria bacterium]